MADALAGGTVSSADLTRGCLARIREVDDRLGSVIAVNPRAIEAADEADRRRGTGARSRLDGIPFVLKDNIDAAGLATTAGSLALIDNIAARDAPIVARLLNAGAVLLAKTNLSEWANIRASRSVHGWSAVGGQTRNPYALDRSPCGSSSGSAVAVAASIAPAAIGTETDGSIVWPAAISGVVGLKPTVGLLPGAGIVPISHSQDTAGPMARSVADLAIILDVMATPAPPGYFERLEPRSLERARLGVMRFLDFDARTWALFDRALDVMRARGATIIDIETFDMAPIMQTRLNVLLTEFRVGVNAYLSTCNSKVPERTLADLIAFNRQEPRELLYFGQDLFEAAERTTGLSDPLYVRDLAAASAAARADGIDRLMREHQLNALIAPSNDAAWRSNPVLGDTPTGSASTLAATAGYPHLTVPMGHIAGLPIGMSFVGSAWSEPCLLSLGFAFEGASNPRRPPTYLSTVMEGTDLVSDAIDLGIINRPRQPKAD